MVTTALRFGCEDLVRGAEDTLDAENAAARDLPFSCGRTATDFCFLRPGPVAEGSGDLLATLSILVLRDDGAVFAASPILFDGSVLPRAAVASAASHLEVTAAALWEMALSSPVSAFEQEQLEARTRQCRAARRYLLEAFGLSHSPIYQGSYYVSASVVHPRSYSSSSDKVGTLSLALDWQPRLQGPLVVPPSNTAATHPLWRCIEPFGGLAGAGIINGFVVARNGADDDEPYASQKSALIHLCFGILPGEGVVLLPRFEVESDADCRALNDLVRGIGAYVERVSINEGDFEANAGGVCHRNGASAAVAIAVDPLDDTMVHVVTPLRIATVKVSTLT